MTNFPVNSYREAAEHLRRPFSPAAVRWKVQVQYPKANPTKGLIVGYVDARLVSERLNLVVPHLWTDSYSMHGDRIDSGHIVCHLTIDGLTRSDIGEGKGKAGYSDAFKRAAVKFGVGVSLYAMSAVELSTTGKYKLRVGGSGDKKRLEITPDVDKWLRNAYAKWIETARFGSALDHGDAGGSAGAIIEGGEAPQQDDLELATARAELEELYEERTKDGGKRKLPQGRFQAQLEAAQTGADLDELRKRVEDIG